MNKDVTDGKGKCFVIGPVGPPDTSIRKHADYLYNYIILPVAVELGLECERADRISGAGWITQEIADHLLNADVVVADLSFGNPNAYYELGIRHMLLRPFVHIAREEDRANLPFDVGQTRTISFDLTDLASVEAAKQSLLEAIKTEVNRSPNAIALPFVGAMRLAEASREALEKVREKPATEELILFEVMAEIQQLSMEVRRLGAFQVDFLRERDRVRDHQMLRERHDSSALRHATKLDENVSDDRRRIEANLRRIAALEQADAEQVRRSKSLKTDGNSSAERA